MKILIFIGFYLLLLTSCQQRPQNIFIGSVRMISDFPKTVTLIGDTIAIDNFGANTIHIIDSFMIFAGGRLDTFYKVCSKYDYTYLGNYIPQGRGQSELSSISFPLFYQTDSSGAKIFLQDRENLTIKTFNITKSVKKRRTVFDNENIDIKNLPGLKTLYPINDTLFFLHYFNYRNNKECYALLNSDTQIPLYTDTIYNNSISSRGNIFLWNTFGSINYNKKRYVTAMQFFNQINIYNIDTRNALTIIPNNTQTQIKEVEETLMPEKMEYYEDLISTDSQIWALYANKNRKDWATQENISTEIHVLDWDGNPLVKFILPQKINKIALDEEQKILYGMTSSEKVFKYPINQLQ